MSSNRAIAAYAEESPTMKSAKPRCVRIVTHGIQLGCLFIIPVLAISVIMVLTIFAIRCDASGGFIVGPDGKVLCVASEEVDDPSGTTTTDGVNETSAPRSVIVMTVTRVVLISVSIFIVSFTAWICVWYQRYGRDRDANTTTTVAAIATPSAAAILNQDVVLTLHVNEYLAKEDLETLLGPEHLVAAAV